MKGRRRRWDWSLGRFGLQLDTIPGSGAPDFVAGRHTDSSDEEKSGAHERVHHGGGYDGGDGDGR